MTYPVVALTRSLAPSASSVYNSLAPNHTKQSANTPPASDASPPVVTPSVQPIEQQQVQFGGFIKKAFWASIFAAFLTACSPFSGSSSQQGSVNKPAAISQQATSIPSGPLLTPLVPTNTPVSTAQPQWDPQEEAARFIRSYDDYGALIYGPSPSGKWTESLAQAAYRLDLTQQQALAFLAFCFLLERQEGVDVHTNQEELAKNFRDAWNNNTGSSPTDPMFAAMASYPNASKDFANRAGNFAIQLGLVP